MTRRMAPLPNGRGAGLAQEGGADRRLIASGHRCDTSAAATLVNRDHIIDAGKLPGRTVVHARSARSAIEPKELRSIGLPGVVLVGQGMAPAGDERRLRPRRVVESPNSATVLVVSPQKMRPSSPRGLLDQQDAVRSPWLPRSSAFRQIAPTQCFCHQSPVRSCSSDPGNRPYAWALVPLTVIGLIGTRVGVRCADSGN